MKGLKRFFAALAAAVIMTGVFTAGVSADVVAEPSNNFYYENPEKCEYIKWRKYTVLRDIETYASPGGKKSNGSASEGDVVQVGFVYTDDEEVLWGCISFREGCKDGWAKMEDMEVIYDVYSFIEENEDNIRKYDGELDEYIPQKDVIVWEYPFSENYSRIKKDSWYTKETYPFALGTIASKCWTDENGNVWAYSPRFADKDSSRITGWIFLSDPETENLADLERKYDEKSDNAAADDISARYGTEVSGMLISEEDTETAYKSAVRSINGRTYTLPAVLVILTAAASGILIKKLGK